MGKYKVRNSMNYKTEETPKKYFTGVSQSVPDQTMSLREIMARYARGLSIDGEKTPIWDEEGLSHGINPKTLDLVDIQRIKEENKIDLENLKASAEVSKQRRQEERANQRNSEKPSLEQTIEH